VPLFRKPPLTTLIAAQRSVSALSGNNDNKQYDGSNACKQRVKMLIRHQ